MPPSKDEKFSLSESIVENQIYKLLSNDYIPPKNSTDIKLHLKTLQTLYVDVLQSMSGINSVLLQKFDYILMTLIPLSVELELQIPSLEEKKKTELTALKSNWKQILKTAIPIFKTYIELGLDKKSISDSQKANKILKTLESKKALRPKDRPSFRTVQRRIKEIESGEFIFDKSILEKLDK